MERADIVIVGGGIAGAATAYALSSHNLKIVMFEPDSVGMHASGRAFGVIPPSTYGAEYGSKLNCGARAKHQELSKVLPKESGIDYGFNSKPHIELAISEERANELQRNAQEPNSVSPAEKVTWLNLDELRREEPRMADTVVGGSVLEGNFELDPLKLTQALWRVAERRGAELVNEPAESILTDQNRVVGVKGTTREIQCATTVLAAGSWITKFINLPITPARGQILRLRTASNPLPYVYFWGKSSYASSKPSGLTYVGGSEELGVSDLSPPEESRLEISRSAYNVFPYLADYELVEHSACLRPMTPDREPILDLPPNMPGLALIGGAGRNGILQSPLLGGALCDMILKGADSPEFKELKAERFLGYDELRLLT